ncbi:MULTISPECIES: DUF3613 domain-containing protein [Cupriavidus]|uniref:DUF3613 domain-containing protein n=1 Tax=Cupriavidus campinensis TaxID=151783 RepID=A0AAE9I4E3_9BURK|nr:MULTISPECIES: DUF3613 domain-containing protein [Cupriavidus]URF07232.1 DUF3613 domain-containing protein [Cupriavidus campinensis]
MTIRRLSRRFFRRSFRHLALLAPLALLSAAPASAQTAEPQPAPAQLPVGQQTRTLLEIQRNGSQAGAAIPLGGEQAAIGYERYMRSFRYELPEFFTSQATGSPLRGGGSNMPPAPNGQ